MAGVAKELVDLTAHVRVLETKVDEMSKDVVLLTSRLDRIDATLNRLSGGLRMLVILGALAAGLVSVAGNLGIVKLFWRK